MEENKFTEEIIQLVNKCFSENNISNSDLFQIAFVCQTLSLKDSSNLILENKNIIDYKSEMQVFAEKNDSFFNENEEELPNGKGEEYVRRFVTEQLLNNYGTKLDISISDIEKYANTNTDLDIYFGDNGGELKIQLEKEDISFENSNIKYIFDQYSLANNKKYNCPSKMTVPFQDLFEVCTYLKNNTSAKAYFQTAVSESSNSDYYGRVIVILVCDTGNKIIKYYDTFKLCPPDGGC